MKNLTPLSSAKTLSPRRQEILAIIQDHARVSFDFLYRRFMLISPRLLRYDLKQLQDKGFIRKLGNTKGALYELTEFKTQNQI